MHLVVSGLSINHLFNLWKPALLAGIHKLNNEVMAIHFYYCCYARHYYHKTVLSRHNTLPARIPLPLLSRAKSFTWSARSSPCTLHVCRVHVAKGHTKNKLQNEIRYMNLKKYTLKGRKLQYKGLLLS